MINRPYTWACNCSHSFTSLNSWRLAIAADKSAGVTSSARRVADAFSTKPLPLPFPPPLPPWTAPAPLLLKHEPSIP